MSLVFTQLAADSFVRANESPLNPATWANPGFYASLQIVSNSAEGTAVLATNDNFEYYTGVSVPANQYAEVQITSITSGNEFGVELRGDNSFNVYDFDIISNGDGTCTAQLFVFVNNNNVATLFSNPALPFSNGDVFRAAAFGSSLTWYKNGVLFASVTDTTFTSGKTGLFVSTTTLAGIKLNNFATGTVSGGSNQLSGNIGIEGQPLANATINWTGTSSGSTTTDTFGNWTTGATLTAGSYLLIPFLSGYTFQPSQKTAVITTQDVVGINFLAIPSVTEGFVSNKELHIEYTGSPAKVQSDINSPDNVRGSSTVQIVNENLPITVTLPVGLPQPGKYGTVHGRFDSFNVLNNPA